MPEPLHERLDRYRMLVKDLMNRLDPTEDVRQDLSKLHTGLVVATTDAYVIKDDFPRPFNVYRKEYPEAKASAKKVATGVQFTDGTVTIRWEGHRASTTVWESMADALAVLGHDDSTRLVWPNI